jgi:hypothetical protein
MTTALSGLVFLVTSLCLVGSGGLIASALRLRRPVAFILASYVVAWAEVVALIALLSSARLVIRPVVVAAVAALLPASALVWLLAGRPSPPPVMAVRAQLRDAFRDPAVAVLAGVVGLGFAYLVALALFTPANSWDAMWYHLARAASWRQQHAVGYIAHAPDLRLNVNPPVAEIGALYTMVVASGDRFVTLPALSAYCATTVAVFGIAQRLRLDVRRALLSALIFATLPVVVLQAPGALNDLVVASFLAVCVCFWLGDRRAEIALGAVALALALGTKISALPALPIVALVVLVAQPRRRLPAFLIAGACALVLGSTWYVVNLAETGSVDGHLAAQAHQTAAYGVWPTLAVTARLVLDFVEVPGASGWWRLWFLVAAVAAVVFVYRERPRSRTARTAGLAALVALAPLGLLVVGPLAKRGYQWVFFHLGHPELAVLDQDRGFIGASALGSFFGPVGVLFLVCGIAVPFLVSSHRVRRIAIALGAAPLLFALALALTVAYDSWRGRFFVFPVALAAAAAGLFFRSRAIVWGVVGVAATTLFLSLWGNDEKPPSVWGESRAAVQTRVGGRNNGELAAIKFTSLFMSRHAHVGLAIGERDWSYPFFDGGLDRTVRFVTTPGSPPTDVDWLVVAPAHASPSDAWARVFQTSDGWQVFTKRKS